MRYDEFRHRWEEALREARLLGISDRASEEPSFAQCFLPVMSEFVVSHLCSSFGTTSEFTDCSLS